MSDTDSKREFTRFERVDIAQYINLRKVAGFLYHHRHRQNMIEGGRHFGWFAGVIISAVIIVLAAISYFVTKNIYFSVGMPTLAFLYLGLEKKLANSDEKSDRYENVNVKPISPDLQVIDKLALNVWNTLYDKANELDQLIRGFAPSLEQSQCFEVAELLKEVSEIELRVKSFLESLDRICEIEMRNKNNPDEVLTNFALNTSPFFSPDSCEDLLKRVNKTLTVVKRELVKINEGSLLLVDHGEDFGALSITKYQEEQGAVSMIPREEKSSDDENHD